MDTLRSLPGFIRRSRFHYGELKPSGYGWRAFPVTGSIQENGFLISGKDPVNFFPALYPVENNGVIIGDPDADAIRPGTYAPEVWESFHSVDTRIRENIFWCRDFIKYQPFYPGPVTFGDCSQVL
jgi:hypothetical protein